jgi:SAM-dependent methyltransferase
MYNLLKKTISFILPKKIIFNIEPYLRNFYSIFKKGKNHYCSICGFKSKKWIILLNEDNLCPKCGSLSRDRRLWKILKENHNKKNIKVLDFSPSRSLFRKWKKIKNINYIASDLSGDFISDVKFDITQSPEKENTFDLIICYHVLEHVIDDVKAMQELFRVLKPNATILIQTPFKEGEIYEDYSILSKSERLKHFGQEDHVRTYSVSGLKERLESVSFKIEILSFMEDSYYGFQDNEIILIAKK